MQIIFITGNLAADCEIVKPTYYNCRMAKTGLADYLKKGRYVSVSGRLKVSTNVKEDKTYVNLDVWVSNIDLAPAGKD